MFYCLVCYIFKENNRKGNCILLMLVKGKNVFYNCFNFMVKIDYGYFYSMKLVNIYFILIFYFVKNWVFFFKNEIWGNRDFWEKLLMRKM